MITAAPQTFSLSNRQTATGKSASGEEGTKNGGLQRAPFVEPRGLLNDCCGVSKGEKCNAKGEERGGRGRGNEVGVDGRVCVV